MSGTDKDDDGGHDYREVVVRVPWWFSGEEVTALLQAGIDEYERRLIAGGVLPSGMLRDLEA